MVVVVQCTQCGRDLDADEIGERVASISGSIYGDECTESWYLCTNCQAYTVEIHWDMFLGDDSVSVRGPVARFRGR